MTQKKNRTVRVKDLRVKKDVKGGMLACNPVGRVTPIVSDPSTQGNTKGIIAILIGL